MPSVLLIEDNRPVLAVLKWALSAVGFELVKASNLLEVERCLKASAPSALVMNIPMPRQIKEPFFELWRAHYPQITIADLIDTDEEGPSHLADIYAELPFDIEAFARQLYATAVDKRQRDLVG